MADNTEWVWLHNAETGGTARFPTLAREGWEARGWVEVEAPAADDGTGTPVGVQDDPEDQEAVSADLPEGEQTTTEATAKPARRKQTEVTDNG